MIPLSRSKSNGAPVGLLQLYTAAALRGVEGVVRSIFHSTELATTAGRCALAELQAGLACRPACSRSQLCSAGTPLAQPDVPAIMRLGWSLVPIGD
jgi:hypothetical protein